ncbi:MAG: sulfatase [Acidobacteria bacterium]|nr:sulfatase [Acidobacteriota bacterium]
MDRRTALKTVAGFPAILGAQNRKPNVLFIMTDDQRWDAMSCAGNKILKTPNMDRLAAGGVRFADAFATNPLCSPSRGTILTGLHTHAHGVTTNGGKSHLLKPGVVTYPQLLQKAGYHSSMLGKWHIATMPTGLGFDHWCILPGQGLYHNPQMIANGGRIQLRGYVDDLIADQAIETLKSRPKNKPFSMICNFKAPHRAWEPAERHAKEYEDIVIPEPPTFNTSLEGRPKGIRDTDMQVADMPDFRRRGVPAALPKELRKPLNYQQFMKNYYRVLLGVDENLGRILDFLDQQRLAEDTLIIYTGDNGFFLGEYGMFDKRLMYEPSIRIPMLVRYPNGIKPGVDRDHMVINNDVAHTILDYCGIQRPAHMEHHGESWRPVFEGRASGWRASWMYEYFEYPGPHCAPIARGVRTKTHKLIHYIQQPQAHEMFDLVKDPEERRSVYDDPAYKAQAAALSRDLEQWRTVTKDDRSQDGTPAPPCGNRMPG